MRYKDRSNIVKSGYIKRLKQVKKQLAIKQFKDPQQLEIKSVKIKGRKMSEDTKQKLRKINTTRADYRNIAIEAHGTNCQRCGKQLKNDSDLVVHHINGEHCIDKLTDNSLDNLLVLCKSCHTKLHHEQKDFSIKFVGLTQFEKAANLILDGIKRMGFILDDDNFKNTPKRFARAYYEIFNGVKDTEKQVKGILSTAFPSNSNGIVIASNVTVYSMCPHHLLPVEYKVALGYIPSPDGKVLGISKLVRLAKVLAKRPVLQEAYTKEMVNALQELGIEGAMAYVVGSHMCMKMRGVEAQDTPIITSSCSGAFKDCQSAREEFLFLSGIKK